MRCVTSRCTQRRDQINDGRTERGSDRRTWSCGFDGRCGGVHRGDHDEAVLRRLVGWEEVVENPLHCLRRLGQEQPRATSHHRATSVASLRTIVQAPSPHFAS
jgi:hypothetical protein